MKDNSENVNIFRNITGFWFKGHHMFLGTVLKLEVLLLFDFSGAREFVRVVRKSEPDDLVNSAVAGFGSGALLGRLQGRVLISITSICLRVFMDAPYVILIIYPLCEILCGALFFHFNFNIVQVFFSFVGSLSHRKDRNISMLSVGFFGPAREADVFFSFLPWQNLLTKQFVHGVVGCF
jgi:hypothetical protein